MVLQKSEIKIQILSLSYQILLNKQHIWYRAGGQQKKVEKLCSSSFFNDKLQKISLKSTLSFDIHNKVDNRNMHCFSKGLQLETLPGFNQKHYQAGLVPLFSIITCLLCIFSNFRLRWRNSVANPPPQVCLNCLKPAQVNGINGNRQNQ